MYRHAIVLTLVLGAGCLGPNLEYDGPVGGTSSGVGTASTSVGPADTGTSGESSSGAASTTGSTGMGSSSGAGTGGTTGCSPLASMSLEFDGIDDHVAVAHDAAFQLTSFTLEAWVRYQVGGVGTMSGIEGLQDARPILTRGRGESDGGPQDLNFFTGVESGIVGADLEDDQVGVNYAARDPDPFPVDTWTHFAATYDGGTWVLYRDGQAVATETPGVTPRTDGTHRVGIATAFDLADQPQGYLRGGLDEIRVWSVARSAADIEADMDRAVTTAPDLVARWGFEEGMGTTALDSAGGHDGQIVGANWNPDGPVLCE